MGKGYFSKTKIYPNRVFLVVFSQFVNFWRTSGQIFVESVGVAKSICALIKMDCVDVLAVLAADHLLKSGVARVVRARLFTRVSGVHFGVLLIET